MGEQISKEEITTQMKIVLIVLLVLVALVIIMILIGRMLPEGHIAVQSKSFSSSPSEVWEVISGVEDWKSWRSDLKDITITNDSTFKADDVEYLMSIVVPGESFTTTIVTKDLPYGGMWHYIIEKEGDGCKLTVTEIGDVYNPMFRFMSRFIFGHDGSLKDYMEVLSKRIQ
jgi:hypothetical protein